MASFSKRIVSASFAIAVMAGAASAAPELTVNGDVDYRLRGQWDLVLDSTGKYYPEKTMKQFANVYAWNLKLGAKVNDNVALKFRLSNPYGSAGETVGKPAGTTGKENYLAIPQAEIKYTIGKFGVSAGLLEVNNSTTLNLVRAAEEKGYLGKIDISNNWSARYNNSLPGLKVSFAPTEMIGLNVVAGIAEFSAPSDTAKGFTDMRMIADAPISFAEDKFTVTPSIAVRSGLTGSYEKREMNTNGGIDFSGKVTDAFTLKAGAAYGQFWNADAKKATDWMAPSALLLSINPAIKFGINSVSVGYSFGQAKDRELSGDAAYSMLTNHVDVKWGVGLAKGFAITPRYRMWATSDTKDGTDSKVSHRPELIFSAKF